MYKSAESAKLSSSFECAVAKERLTVENRTADTKTSEDVCR